MTETPHDQQRLVETLASAFNAVEVPGQRRVQRQPCVYATHRHDRWRLVTGGPVTCGICHPPAVHRSSR